MDSSIAVAWRRRSASAAGLIALATAVVLSGCGRHVPDDAPPRANDAPSIPVQSSIIAVPISADLADLSVALERAVPTRLWSIDKPGQACVASRRVKVLLVKIKTPTLTCRIVGEVTRGRMAISGRGRDLIVVMPIHAVVHARDIGGVLKQETATADARVRAIVRLDMAPDWSPRGKISIAYDWTNEPGIDFLGQRIDFTSKADAKLQGVIAKLEQTLPRELTKLHFREQVQRAWGQAFTSLKLNSANPPVWMRITPSELDYGGYAVEGRTLVMRLGMKARTETFVGDRPADPRATPLPRMKPLTEPAGAMLFTIPVIADYRQLEPVIQRALVKRSARPFDVPGIGPVHARFGKVTAYGTIGGRVAVGVNFAASAPGSNLATSRGTIWLTGTPLNPPNTRQVSFADLAVSGLTDNTGTNLLLKMANAPGLSATIATALTQNFANDYDKLMGKIDHAIEEKREGKLVIRARIDDVRTGSLKASGLGLYLPVYGKGTVSIVLAGR
ncbi:MAG: DUF4403 family protein [Sphingomonas sp.]